MTKPLTKDERDGFIEFAKQAGMIQDGEVWFSPSYVNCDVYTVELLFFAKLVVEKEREVVANWIMDRGFATGHGDSIVDLLDQLEWQIEEKEREACANICEEKYYLAVADAIRARGQA